MGRAKKQRSKGGKSKAAPMEDISPMSADLAHLPREQADIFGGLADVQGAIREAACVHIATIFGDSDTAEQDDKAREMLQALVAAGVLPRLIPLVLDPMRMVRLHALGALRNISVTGGADVCELMVAANVMTPLARVIAENATADKLAPSDLTSPQMLEQAIALLSNICESCPAAIQSLMRENLLDPVMLIAQGGRAHAALHLETLKLLLLITESNPVLNEVFGSNAQYQQVLGELAQAQDASGAGAMHTRLYAAGIAMNIQAIMQNDANVAKLVAILEEALAFDAMRVVQMAQQAAESWDLAHKSIYADDSETLDPVSPEEREQANDAQVKCRLWKESARTLTLALELIADVAAGNAEEDADDEEWGSDDEDAMEQYAAAQMHADDAASSTRPQSGTPVFKALSASRVFELCGVILQGLVSIPMLGASEIASDFSKMRIRVCNALNNLLQLLPWEVLPLDRWQQLFSNLCTLCRNAMEAAAATHTSDPTQDVESAVTAAMWSVLRRAAREHQQIAIAADDALLITTSAQHSRSVETRLNTIGMLGCVGQQSRDPAENAVIGRCLGASLADPSLEAVAAALNALFDVYGDETFDTIFQQLGLLPALQAAVPTIKTKLRAEQAQLDRDLIAHIKETQLNLVRFIKYKKQHLRA